FLCTTGVSISARVGLQVLHDLRRDDLRRDQRVGSIQHGVAYPRDVEVDLVTGQELFKVEHLDSLGLTPRRALLSGLVTRTEVVQQNPGQRALRKGAAPRSAEGVEPHSLNPRPVWPRWLLIEEQYVRLHTTRVEDPHGQAQHRVQVELLEQSAADGLACAALEEHVVWDDHGGPAMYLQQRSDVLEEVELLVGDGDPEVL